jgi:hypothetical protein
MVRSSRMFLCAIVLIAGCPGGSLGGGNPPVSSNLGSLTLSYDNQFDQQGDDMGGGKPYTTVPVLWHGDASDLEEGQQSFDDPESATGFLTDPWNSNTAGGSAIETNLAAGTWTVSLTVNAVPIGTCSKPLAGGQNLVMTFVKNPDDTFGGCP